VTVSPARTTDDTGGTGIMDAPNAAADSRRAGWRWEPLTGIAFVVLFVAAVFILPTPNDDDPDKTWLAFYADHTHQVLSVVAAFMFVFAGLCLLAFLTCVWQRIRARRPGTSPLPLLTATMAAMGIALAGLVGATITGAMIFGSLKEPGVDALKVVEEMAFPILLIGGVYPAALSVAVLGFQARAAGLFPKWLLILSYVAGVVLLGSVVFFPMILLVIWVIVVAIFLLRSGPAPAAASASAT
jgi:hypothetical protein